MSLRMRRLSFKLIFSLVGALGLVFALFGYQLTELHRSDLEKVTFESANRISDSIKRSILYSMQQNHREHIYHSIVTIGGEPGINKIRIFNEVGKISFSSDAGENTACALGSSNFMTASPKSYVLSPESRTIRPNRRAARPRHSPPD